MKRSAHSILYIVMIVAMCVWGLSWTNAKILGTFTTIPILMFWRFLIAGISMGLVLLVKGVDFKITRAGVPFLVASAVFLVLYNVFYFTGTRLGAAGAGGVLVTTLNPVFTFLLLSAVRRHLPVGRALAGLLLGILGGSILINVWQDGWIAVFKSGNQYFVLCAGTWAFLTFISSRINTHMSTLTYSFWLYLMSALFAFFFTEQSQVLTVFGLGMIFWLNLLSISLGAMAFGTTAYFIAASRLGSEKASAFIFTVPLSALVFSMIILKEPLEWNIVLGGSLSIIAVILINTSKKIA